MTGASRPSAEVVEVFASGPMAPRQARHWIEPVLSAWAAAGVAPDVLLVVSELVTNAVIHGQGPVVVRAMYRPDGLRIEVSDEGDGQVLLRESDPASTGGRGLVVVAHLCRSWGVTERSPVGKTVWVELAD